MCGLPPDVEYRVVDVGPRPRLADLAFRTLLGREEAGGGRPGGAMGRLLLYGRLLETGSTWAVWPFEVRID
jgi:hypothetical protein